ncbi:MAG: response regulator transcription factor [Planctomycetes bacterium]|nr:response regulator transcription factor [Planctomycetota bacterium]MCB9909889.1 response regulator transcription factor [Planctomycetota bacterium]HPF13053.1 response regulator transcription factor [Planctomycetota bacterium]
MKQSTILIIEDDADIVELLQYNLTKEGFRVRVARDGDSGLHEARRYRPDLILLDLMLPGVDGLEVCRRLKRDSDLSSTPVLMVTAKAEESDVVSGLEMGADDYLSKPFSPRELLARVRAVLRRGQSSSEHEKARLEFGGVVLDRPRHEVTVDDRLVEFTRAEFRLLWALGSSPGRVFARDELVEFITGGEAHISDRNVDVHVSAIRKKLEPYSDLVKTVRGVGYKIKD